MVRSAEAIRKRAQKRNRTEDEQRRIDGSDAKKKRLEEPSAHETRHDQLPQGVESEHHPALQEAGAWKCKGCGNHNFASRHTCHSKTCHEMRPSGTFVPQPWRQSRHDPTTSKTLVWAPLASKQQIMRNHELRSIYLETGGEGMNEDDVKRAKILIARDERKSQKKSAQSEFIEKPPVISKERAGLKQENSELRKLYRECNGEGMAEEDVTRAKILLARDDRKSKQKSRNGVQNSESENVEKQQKQMKEQVSLKLKNRELRKLYQACGGEGMTEEDVIRAKILIARDDRKALKKLPCPALPPATQFGKSDKIFDEQKVENSEIDCTAEIAETVLHETKALKKQARALRKRFMKSGGEGMSEEDLVQAKILAIKAERKKRRKERQVSEKA